jgi:hypothetical protein
MSPLKGHFDHTIIRILIIAASGIAAGYIFYGFPIFITTVAPFQFTYHTITAALFYGILKSSSRRSALLAVLVWCAISTLIDVKNTSVIVMDIANVAGVSAAMYLYLRLLHRPILSGVFQRLATASLLVGAANALIAIGLILFWAVLAGMSLQRIPQAALSNFQIGTLIGLGIGTGIEISEYVIRLKSFQRFIEDTRQE